MNAQSPKIVTVRISRINPNDRDILLPAYATNGSSGMDMYAAVEKETVVKPGETVLLPSGFRIEVPQGYEAQVRPRSGLAIKHGIGILNSPGTIDSDYRGEVKIILTNFGKENFIVQRGDRIAQLVLAPVVRAEWVEVKEVQQTSRGAGGFGHSGR
ncbi:MAG: dUTP diphosphatase [Ignavibacteriae bacterium]|nr:dUTP diphosphatase [Ignavibacteriota bacterium]